MFVRNQQSPTLNLVNTSRFQALIDSEAEGLKGGEVEMEAIGFEFGVENRDEKGFILSQDFFLYTGLYYSRLMSKFRIHWIVIRKMNARSHRRK